MPYCGGKPNDPRRSRPRALATHPDQCKGQLRAYGRRMIDVANDGAAQTLLQRASRTLATCGMRSPGKRLVDCKRQRRLFGLIPFVDSADDVSFRSYVANTSEEAFVTFPRVQIDHPYTRSIYEHTHPKVKGTVLFLSCAAKATSENASPVYERPQDTPGSIGWALGYFDPVRITDRTLTFNITRVEVNAAYRGGDAMVWVLSKLMDAARRRSSAISRSVNGVLLQMDPEGPCIQMGNGMDAKLEQALTAGYTKAGFERMRYKEGRRIRWTFQILLEL